jgi:hypothetical protein
MNTQAGLSFSPQKQYKDASQRFSAVVRELDQRVRVPKSEYESFSGRIEVAWLEYRNALAALNAHTKEHGC